MRRPKSRFRRRSVRLRFENLEARDVPIASVWLQTIPFDDLAQEDAGGGAGNAYFSVNRDGNLGQELLVWLDQGGQVDGRQYTLSVPGYGDIPPGSPIPIPQSATSVTVTLTPIDDPVIEGTQHVMMTVEEPIDQSYTVGTPSMATLHILDDEVFAPPPVVISQVYGGGGEEGADYDQDFVELFNRTTSPVSLSHWSLQYANAGSAQWQVVPLSGILDPGKYLLIGGATGANGRNTLPTPDVNSGLDFAAAAGKVALLNNSNALVGVTPSLALVVDAVGYGEVGEVEWFEGTGSASATDPTTAATRLGHGNFDSDDNSWDFFGDTLTPRNSADATANLGPTVTSVGTQLTAINTPLAISGFQVTDPDAGNEPIEISLDVDSGTLSLAHTTGLMFTTGDGTGDEEMTFTGNLTDIASALGTVTFTPEADFEGAAFATLWGDDLGNTGAGGSLSDYGSAFIVVGGPVVAIDDEVETQEDTAFDFDVLANDVWAGTTVPGFNILSGPSHGTAVIDGDRVHYTPNDEYHGSDSLTY